jgi:Mrp family chromosome partitioning ATPase
VWDVPPLTTAPVALVLAREVDAIVLLTQAHRTRRQVALHTAQRLQESGGRLLGVVLNRSLNFIPAWIYRLL